MTLQTPFYISFSDAKNIKLAKQLICPTKSELIFIFDIDETLYNICETSKAVRRLNLYKYLYSLGYNSAEAGLKCNEFSEKYGISIKGFSKDLCVGQQVYSELCSPTLEAINFIKPQANLKNVISKLDGRKFCFTNAEERFCKPVLKAIGLEDCFEAVFCCDYTNIDFLCKPSLSAYETVEIMIGSPPKKNIHFFDDRIINIKSALKVGWNGYLVSEEKNIERILSTFK